MIDPDALERAAVQRFLAAWRSCGARGRIEVVKLPDAPPVVSVVHRETVTASATLDVMHVAAVVSG